VATAQSQAPSPSTLHPDSFRRYCGLVFPDKGLRDKVTILRPDVDPGEEAQVDYGYLGTFSDRVTGKMRRVWAFVIVLAFSRHMFVRPVLKMDQVSWVAAHVAGFEYFGGVPNRLVSEYVPRNIFALLCPGALCGRRVGPARLDPGERAGPLVAELAKLAKETGLEVTVCHYPPGTSKWNKIEHRLFSFITMNWRGRPLTSYRVIVQLIANTTTKKGLKVNAELDQGHYPTGVKITDKQLAAVPLTRHEFQGAWNYTVHPEPLK
jgi:hypothetical protein